MTVSPRARLDHVVFRCADLSAMLHFYMDILGCRCATLLHILYYAPLALLNPSLNLVPPTAPRGVATALRALAPTCTANSWRLSRRSLSKHNEAAGIYHLDAGGGTLIDLVDTGATPAVGPHNVDHQICLKVLEFDEAAIRAHLESHGVATQPATNRFGAGLVRSR